jgi:3',5'-cyclic AMP phosphodiesterase CpdA
MVSFRLIHISDLHFSQYPSNESIVDGGARAFLKSAFGDNKSFYPTSYAPDLAIKLAKQLARRSDFDAILITGDLATHGDSDDLLTALNFLRGEVPKDSLAGGPVPKLLSMAPNVILPGNHDRYKGRRCLPGGRKFESVFGVNWDANMDTYEMFSGDHVGRVVLEKGEEKLAICSADFSLRDFSDHTESNFGWMGQGKINEDVLRHLELITLDLRRYKTPVAIVWAVHFPPKNDDAAGNLSLINESLLAASADRHDVQLIFAGHTHKGRHYSIPGHRAEVLCAGSATGYSDTVNSFYDVYLEVQEGKIVGKTPTLFKWDEDRAKYLA